MTTQVLFFDVFPEKDTHLNAIELENFTINTLLLKTSFKMQHISKDIYNGHPLSRTPKGPAKK